MPIDQDIQDGIGAAGDYAAALAAKLARLGVQCGDQAPDEVLKELGLLYRMGTELRRQVDHLNQALTNRQSENRENGR